MGALARLLHQHEPYPAVVMDRRWDVVRVNDGAARLFGGLCAPDPVPDPANVLRLMLEPGPVRAAVRNWDDVAPSLLERARREAVGGVMDLQTAELVQRLRTGADAAVLATPRPVAPVVPVVDVQFDFGVRRCAGSRSSRRSGRRSTSPPRSCASRRSCRSTRRPPPGGATSARCGSPDEPPGVVQRRRWPVSRVDHSSRDGCSSMACRCTTASPRRRAPTRCRSSTCTGSRSPAPTWSRPRRCSPPTDAPTSPICPGWAAACGRRSVPDLEGLATSLVHYLDVLGIERATFVGNSLGCPIIIEVATSYPRSDRPRGPRVAGRRAEQPAAGAGAGQMSRDVMREPLGCGRSPVVTTSGSASRAASPCSGDDPLPDPRSAQRPGDADARDRRHPRPAGPPRSHPRPEPDPARRAIRVPGAHALNFSRAEPLADLIRTFLQDGSLRDAAARHPGVEVLLAADDAADDTSVT